MALCCPRAARRTTHSLLDDVDHAAVFQQRQPLLHEGHHLRQVLQLPHDALQRARDGRRNVVPLQRVCLPW